MHSLSASNSIAIVYNRKSLPAAKCQECGAKMYPKSLLKPHLNRHQLRQRWLMNSLGQLRTALARMGNVA